MFKPEADYDPVPALLRLGSQIAGCPVYLVPPEGGSGADGPPQPLPAPAYLEERVIGGLGRRAVGTLRAVDIHHRPELKAVRRAVLNDLADVVGSCHASRSLLGRTNSVTGLPNRYQLLEDHAAAREVGAGPRRVLVLVSLLEPRQYADVVRALGHDWAEDIIRTGAGTLQDLMPFGETLYHVSTLSFAFCADGPLDAGLQGLIETIVRAFRAPIACREIPIDIHVGIGVVDCTGTQTEGREALRAGLAAAQDSRATRSGWAHYDEQADSAHKRAFSLLADLRRAIESDTQLSLCFQPRIAFGSRRCVGAEALIRWAHPVLGPVSPGEFIPLAEATALITPLTDWVLSTAAQQAVALERAGYRLPISVNVSPKNLAEPEFVDKLEAMLVRHGLAPDQFELEFTEGTLASDQRIVRQHLNRIRDIGMEIAIDDFGSGYSNMSYLTRIPAQILKIDQAFVRPMMETAKNQHLVRAIIGMGRGLGYRVVAEGIETDEAFAMLADWGCDEAQGYFISRPLMPDAYAAWLAASAGGPVTPAG